MIIIRQYRILFLVFILVFGTVITFYLIETRSSIGIKMINFNQSIMQQISNNEMRNHFHISSNVHIVDLTVPIQRRLPCTQTKTLLRNLTTTICLHQSKKDRYISGAFQNSTAIWEEDQVIRILELLIRHPHLHFIDLGANIGTYTMFVATLGRFVLAVDCFQPNIVRLTRAIQLSNLSTHVVLVQNALFSRSGQSLRLSVDTTNIGGQGILLSGNSSPQYRSPSNLSTKTPYIVETITMDELLPILVARGIRGALIKMDIEGSESFVVESGGRVFDTLDIPFVQMEWKIVRRYIDRATVVRNFFRRRNYDPTTTDCQLLNSDESNLWPDEIFWLRRNISNFC